MSSIKLIITTLTTFSILETALAYYVPANGDDWTKFKPTCDYLPGSFTSLPFKFGIVVNPYIVNNDGELLEPEITSITRSLTTSFVTSIITAAPKPTKTRDIIVQIHDGQVQKVNEELCDDKDLKEIENSKNNNKKVDDNDYYYSDGDDNDKHYKEKPIDSEYSGKKDKSFEKLLEKGFDKRNVHDLGGEYKDKPYEESSKHYHDKHSKHTEEFEEAPIQENQEQSETKQELKHHKKSSKKSHSSYHRGKYDYYTDDEFQSPVYSVACYTSATLRMSLHDSILRDSDDRIGCIVSGHQFQFDGPTPQHGAVFAAGWSVTKDGQLALGNSTKFWQCASGHFYNLYDQSIGFQCHPVTLDVVELIEC